MGPSVKYFEWLGVRGRIVCVFPPVLVQVNKTLHVGYLKASAINTVCILNRTFLDVNTFYCISLACLKIKIMAVMRVRSINQEYFLVCLCMISFHLVCDVLMNT